MSIRYFAILSLLIFLPRNSAANTIDLGTATASHWVITGAGAVAAPALQVSDTQDIALTDNAKRDGNYVSGASNAKFTGLWYADNLFQVPANATAMSFSFSSLQGDDRVVLQLNGTVIGDYFLNTQSADSRTGTGVMQIPPSM